MIELLARRWRIWASPSYRASMGHPKLDDEFSAGVAAASDEKFQQLRRALQDLIEDVSNGDERTREDDVKTWVCEVWINGQLGPVCVALTQASAIEFGNIHGKRLSGHGDEVETLVRPERPGEASFRRR